MAKRTAICAVLLLAIGAGGADARTWHVRKDGTGDFKVIQDAVDQAAAGDTIRIGPGRFEEKKPYTSYPPDKWTVDVYVAVDVADLTIVGSGVDQTFIGPPSPIWQNPQQPKIICALSRVDRLVVEDVSLVCTDGDPHFAWCKPSIAHTSPTVWLSADRGLGTSGSRAFTASDKNHLVAGSAVVLGTADSWCDFFFYATTVGVERKVNPFLQGHRLDF